MMKTSIDTVVKVHAMTCLAALCAMKMNTSFPSLNLNSKSSCGLTAITENAQAFLSVSFGFFLLSTFTAMVLKPAITLVTLQATLPSRSSRPSRGICFGILASLVTFATGSVFLMPVLINYAVQTVACGPFDASAAAAMVFSISILLSMVIYMAVVICLSPLVSSCVCMNSV